MYDTGGAITWKGPEYSQFKPGAGHDELRQKAIGKPAILIWYRYNEITTEDKPFAVFAFQKGKDRWDHLLTNHPELFHKDGVGYTKAPQTFHRPVISPDYEITAKSAISFRSVSNEEALYYRDLFVHKLGTTSGYVAGAVAFSLIEKIGANPFNAHSEETYGITALVLKRRATMATQPVFISAPFLKKSC